MERPGACRARRTAVCYLHTAHKPQARPRAASLTRHRPPAQPTISIDVVPIHTVTKAVTGGVAFAVGKSLDINPRVKLGKLPVKVRASAGVVAPPTPW